MQSAACFSQSLSSTLLWTHRPILRLKTVSEKWDRSFDNQLTKECSFQSGISQLVSLLNTTTAGDMTLVQPIVNSMTEILSDTRDSQMVKVGLSDHSFTRKMPYSLSPLDDNSYRQMGTLLRFCSCRTGAFNLLVSHDIRIRGGEQDCRCSAAASRLAITYSAEHEQDYRTRIATSGHQIAATLGSRREALFKIDWKRNGNLVGQAGGEEGSRHPRPIEGFRHLVKARRKKYRAPGSRC